MRLDRVVLNVSAPEEVANFYTTYLGMHATRVGKHWFVGYQGQGACLQLRPSASAQTYVAKDTDRYWKIGVTIPNVDIAYEQLTNAGVSVSAPAQFRDIGYVCHLSDPEGFRIELLQHAFQGNRPEPAGVADQPLGGGAQIGQITLRVTDIDEALATYRERLGMRLLSIQPVPDLHFTLYFLAFTEETPPNSSLEAIDNREWLWRRPYTTLELQHVQNRTLTAPPADEGPGFVGIVIKDATAEQLIS